MISRHADLGQMEIGMRLRVACCSLMYRKVYTAKQLIRKRIVRILDATLSRSRTHNFVYCHIADPPVVKHREQRDYPGTNYKPHVQ